MECATIGVGTGAQDVRPCLLNGLSADIGFDGVELIGDLVVAQRLAAARQVEIAFDEFDLVLAEALGQQHLFVVTRRT